MVGVKHITQVQRLHLLGGRLFAVDEIQEVGRLPHRRIWRKQALALAMAVKVSRDHGNAGDKAQGLQTIFVHRIVVRFRVKTTERRHRGADGVHRRGVLGKFLDDFDHAFGQFAFRGEQAFQFVQFFAIRQMIVVQQVNHFLERHLAGEFIDVVTAVDQLTDVAADQGPFTYVPGSHRLSPERLAWERRMSLAAARSANAEDRQGSFRIEPSELPALDLPKPRVFAVPGNTLVVADTFGFHARGVPVVLSVTNYVHAVNGFRNGFRDLRCIFRS